MKTKCIIVDDEPLAIEAIEIHLKKFDNIEIIGKFRNAIDALEILRSENVDLIFLDIQMPKITGIEFLKSITTAPKVIITTAYRDFAVESFELDVVDYLVKPIHFDRFVKAIDKFYKLTVPEQNDRSRTFSIEKNYIFLRADRKDVRVNLNEIKYIEAMKDYVQIYLRSNKIINKNTISYFEKILPAEKFCRVHRSFIVSVNMIDAITIDGIEIEKKTIPVSKNFRSNLDNLIKL